MKKFCVVVIAAAFCFGVLGGLASAQTDRGKKAGPGPKVGSKVKDFALTNSSGKKQSLKQLLEKGPVAIVFFRSADW